MAESLGRVLYEEVNYLAHVQPDALRERRLKKYLNMGFFEQETP
jgi:acetyl-CoA carboxylase alpha subunit